MRRGSRSLVLLSLLGALGLVLGCGGGGAGAPGVPDLTPGLETAAPFQELVLGSAGLGPDEDAFVRFADAAGGATLAYSVDVPIAGVDPVAVPTPVFVDPATGEDGIGVVSMTLHGRGRDPIPVGETLTIDLLPPTGRVPGSLARAFLEGVSDLLPAVRADLETLAAAPPDGITVYPDLFLMLDRMEASLAVWSATLPDLVDGSVVSVPVGALTVGDRALALDLDPSVLSLVDRILATFLQQVAPGTWGAGLEDVARSLPDRLAALDADAIATTRALLGGLAACLGTGEGLSRTLADAGAGPLPPAVAATAFCGTLFAPAVAGALSRMTTKALLAEAQGTARQLLEGLRYVGTRMLWSAAADLAGWEVTPAEGDPSAATLDLFDTFIDHVGVVGTFLLRALDTPLDPVDPPPPPTRTFTGAYQGAGVFTNTIGSACRFQTTIQGTLTITLSTTLGATADGTGAWNAQPITTEVGGSPCRSSSGPADFGTSASWIQSQVMFQVGTAPAFSFDGTLSGDVLTGTLTVTFPNATGSILITNLTLR